MQLLRLQIPNKQKDCQVINAFLHFWDLPKQHLLVKCWWNWHPLSLTILRERWQIYCASLDLPIFTWVFFPPSLSLFHTHIHTHARARALSPSVFLSLSLTYTHSLSLSFFFLPSISFSLFSTSHSPSFFLSLISLSPNSVLSFCLSHLICVHGRGICWAQIWRKLFFAHFFISCENLRRLMKFFSIYFVITLHCRIIFQLLKLDLSLHAKSEKGKITFPGFFQILKSRVSYLKGITYFFMISEESG